MQHSRIAILKFRAGAADEALAKGQTGLLPIFHSQPGFVAYGAVKTGDDSGVTISVWETRELAQAAAETSAGWVQNNIASLVESVQNLVGDVSFFASVAAIGN
jgi:heme-degrading monooxygenase HmoA